MPPFDGVKQMAGRLRRARFMEFDRGKLRPVVRQALPSLAVMSGKRVDWPE